MKSWGSKQVPSEGGITACEAGIKSPRIKFTVSLPSPNIWEKRACAISFSDTNVVFAKAGVDRENRLFVTAPQVYLLSCLYDQALCTLLPLLSCLCPGSKRAAQVCFSFPDYLKERKKRKVVFVVFVVALSYFHSLYYCS